MAITADQAQAITDFLSAVARLRALGVVSSDRYLGDLGEFLAKHQYSLTLAKNKRQQGHDTEGDENRAQIKFHNSSTRTNIHLGQPEAYDRVIVVLGPHSLLHPQGEHAGAYLFYEFPAAHVAQHFKRNRGYSCGASHFKTPHQVLRLKDGIP